ncbi:hypothetical protein DESUT3_32340 [Desulfuromonas versatilis]|uniref:histidine kinase n=1 Tax=Desulfuromonas versatilis TaxID=2802975 RepID=A0ABN6E1H3_9BACT|nr:GAF domain-containing protein [Desulfuromonas versatilis]BCR06165.1 hypothetical protein DESUT3_32340 [Desulfuromonas versatilis]
MASRRKDYPLRRILALFAAGVALAGCVLFYLHRSERQETIRNLTRQQELIATQAGTSMGQLLQRLQSGLHRLSAHEELLADPRQAAAQLEILAQNYPGSVLKALCLRDQQGNILAEAPPNILSSSGFPVHLLAGTDGPNLPPNPLQVNGEAILVLNQPITRPNQPPLALKALVDLAGLKNAGLASLGLTASPGFLVDHSGIFLEHAEPELVGRLVSEIVSARDNPQLFHALSAMVQGERGTALIRENTPIVARVLGQTGAPRLLTHVPLQISGRSWSLGLTPPREILDTVGGGASLFGSAIFAVLGLITLLTIPLWKVLGENGRLALQSRQLRRENLHLQQALENTERRCQQLLDNAGDAIFYIDPHTGALREINTRTVELLGYTAQEIRALSLSVLFPGSQHRRYLRLVKKVLTHGYGEESSLVFRCKNGRMFTGAVHARLGELGDEQVVHGVLRDMTEFKRIERELRQRNQDLTLVNEIAHRAAGSRELKEMLDIILQEVIRNFTGEGGGVYLVRHEGTDLELVSHQGIDESVLQELRKLAPGEGLAGLVARSGRPRSSVDLQRDNRLRSEAVRAAGWRGFQAVPLVSNEKTVGVLFVFYRAQRFFSREELNLLKAIGNQVGTAVEGAGLFDALQWQNRLTQASNRELELSRQQLRHHLRSLEEANRKLAQVDQMKSNFLTLASHELRTPLTYVLAGAELLESLLGSRLNGEEVRVLEAVRQGGKRLEEIVQDLLEVARVESQDINLSREAVNLPLLIEDISREFEPVFSKRGLSFSVADIPWPLELRGDSQHLGKTFRRLVENAVKFTPEGGHIEIRGALCSSEEIKGREKDLRCFSPVFFQGVPDRPLLQLTVQDTGVGINPEDQIKVFDKFYEVGDISGHFTSRTRFGGKGVGLGLALVRGVVEAHGGMVWVESGNPGPSRGSAFHVLLPLATEPAMVGSRS